MKKREQASEVWANYTPMSIASQRQWLLADNDALMGIHAVHDVEYGNLEDSSAPTSPIGDPFGQTSGPFGQTTVSFGQSGEPSWHRHDTIDPTGLQTPVIGCRPKGFWKRVFPRDILSARGQGERERERERQTDKNAVPAPCAAEGSSSARVKLQLPSSRNPSVPQFGIPAPSWEPKAWCRARIEVRCPVSQSDNFDRQLTSRKMKSRLRLETKISMSVPGRSGNHSRSHNANR